MSSLSFDTTSQVSEEEHTILSLSDDSTSEINPDIAEVLQMTKKQQIDSKKFEKELMMGEKASKRWTKTQVDTVAAIKDAELFAKNYEYERLQAEFQANLAAKEAETSAEIRQIEAEIGELRTEISSLEIELGEVKDSRKQQLISVRTQIQEYLRMLQDKEIAHNKQIEKLKEALQAVTEKHRNDIEILQTEADNEDQLVEIEIQRLSHSIEQYRRELHKTENTQNHRMAESATVIEMLNNEIENSKARASSTTNEAQATQDKLSRMQQDLIKAEEQILILEEQLKYADEQKAEMKVEVSKLNRALWEARRKKLAYNDIL
ncbi:hypothetical protein TRFO_32997 [Tritrichomonas foetus]|uniref:Kinetoplast-associated protein n=1 Tax=Tritrichomonas foetus TaxID=1144522 RepID=A0A1J4JPM0_9EUKA|nr:hypothetical protein TRFO_32997 [Tritrichomonas foetus]|eukprot:OHT00352.1 hypothetical protein TRFO_32997 [Tritrichomonas foetus]